VIAMAPAIMVIMALGRPGTENINIASAGAPRCRLKRDAHGAKRV